MSTARRDGGLERILAMMLKTYWSLRFAYPTWIIISLIAFLVGLELNVRRLDAGHRLHELRHEVRNVRMRLCLSVNLQHTHYKSKTTYQRSHCTHLRRVPCCKERVQTRVLDLLAERSAIHALHILRRGH